MKRSITVASMPHTKCAAYGYKKENLHTCLFCLAYPLADVSLRIANLRSGSAFCPGDQATSDTEIEVKLMRIANQFHSIKEADLSEKIDGYGCFHQPHLLITRLDSWGDLKHLIAGLIGGSTLELEP
jgi:hypothetical protein